MSRRAFGLVAALTLAACAGGTTSEDESAASKVQITDLPIRYTQPIQTAVFEQTLDHTGAVPGTFKQRYHFTSEFADGPRSPVLFYLCAESTCTPNHLWNLADTAKALHAHVVALEHRYYGESLPFVQPTIDQMRFLTIHNVLEDATAVHRALRERLPGKWIAVGGSYGGMIAAFLREKHPEVVVGAWASSAPVDMRLTYSGYDEVAGRTLGPRCTQLFQQALQAASAAYDVPEQNRLLMLQLFGTPASFGRKVDLLSSISWTAMGSAQHDDEGRFCAALEQHAGNPILGVIRYKRPLLVPDDDVPVGSTPPAAAPAAPATPARPAMTVSEPMAPGEIDAPPSPFYRGRAFDYQKCTEVGFFSVPNPDRSASLMSELVDAPYATEVCRRTGLPLVSIETTRRTYWAAIAAGQVSNLYFVNGDHDPWSSLSITAPDANLPGGAAFVVRGGTHCDDLGNLQRDSLLGVFESHQKFQELARTWLDDTPSFQTWK